MEKVKKVYKLGNPLGLLNQFDVMGLEYYVRESETSVSVICMGVEYFYSLDKDMSKSVHLISMVRKDFNSFLSKNKNFKYLLENYKSTFTNNSYNGGKTIKYDINHAYWRIAYNHKFISKKTYDKGLLIKAVDDSRKRIYCMALSVQGNKKTYTGYKKGEEINKKIEIGKDSNKLKDIYTHIRNKTHFHMDELAYKLGSSFKEYNVDCIEFEDNEKNRKLVSDYLKSKNLTFKIV